MSKQVIYETDDGWYMTSRKNYLAYVQDAWAVKKLVDVTDPYDFIDKACKWWGCKPDDFQVVPRGANYYELYRK